MTKDNIKKILIQNKIKKDFIDNEIVELIKTILDNNSNFATAQNIDEFIYTLYIVIEKSKISTFKIWRWKYWSSLHTKLNRKSIKREIITINWRIWKNIKEYNYTN